MKREELIAYLLSQDCSLDDELETDEFSVVINDISHRVSQLVKEPYISAHTAVVLLRALNVRCHDSLEDYDAVFQAHEHSQQNKPRNFLSDRLN